MKEIKVVAAIIIKENKIFVTQRGYGEFKDWREFPGGKVEKGETSKEALIREIKEELNTDINIEKFLMTVDHTYPSFHLLMDCFICSFKNPIFELKEAEAYKFITKEELDNIKFLPADIKVIEELKKVI